ncbi:monovalent cation/H+ antiporter subunit D [Hydrogenophaga sp. PBL-H3]|uniref:monovalent cation/H+ antiporter subunit D n=1 Tax=Hydrogenophaga sp. PBL-H3 TaxID=434010 RepID=UPI00131F7E8B|nr:monovalent cation/H+ antiporter subunit D [Hydrogenophaga sp. PBL-H3]QHE75765.1 monovalent cation/H+ antiporter subunit D [Hydrogenophaga sp. PBL-H3]QHE80190.1 monovalent cation/H+ antiporter subunit D [Hydrogenophaga sp. PBL-H3]
MTALAQALMPHLMVAPILLPLLAACLLMLVSERRHLTKATLGLMATVANLVVAVLLVFWVKAGDEARAFGIYLPSNWDVPYGIVLVLDRLSALMLVMTALVALMALLFSLARWHKAGAHFHPLFQIQIMGLNGAFLTGDLFNLFVFFEVMLAASYGLLLHGSGPSRVKAGLHYIAINLAASSLFLVGAALIYGVSGTLNMADLAARIPEVPDADRALLHAGCAILAVAFLAKAAMWPLNFWLVPAYASASAPSAAVFALLTKVGIYVLLRLSTLLFSDSAGNSAGFGSQWLLWGGLTTLAMGAIGMMSAQRPARMAGFAVVVSSGTLMAVFGLARPEVTAGALYYLPVSTFAVAAFFLLTELMDRSRQSDPARQQAPEDEEDHLPFSLAELELARSANLDEDEVPLVGRAIPASTALLGLAFIVCTLLLAGLPPLSGFIGKLAILSTLLDAPGGSVAPVSWLLMGCIIGSGLLALLALSRTGIRFFWAPVDRPAPVLRVVEYLPIALLIALCVVFTVRAEAVMRYTSATAAALYQPSLYIGAVMNSRPQPTPTNADRLGVPQPGVSR